MTHTYQITGMTCSSCVAKVKSELLKIGDITSADVQLTYPQATIAMQQHIPVKQLQEAVSRAGKYTIAAVAGGHGMGDMETSAGTKNSYFPIFLIFAYITGVTLLVQAVDGPFDWMQWMSHFMAGFFLVFSFFKLMSLKGFAEGYRTYDVVAKVFPAWGFLYPFAELSLGILFLTGYAPLYTNAAAFLIMGVSSIGVIQSLLQKKPFQCACLGTVIRLPLSKVTLFEDLLMVVMSGAMLLRLLIAG